MSVEPDDTELDALAAQVRSFPHLDDIELMGLLDAAHDGDQEAQRYLVEQQLGSVLDAALAHRGGGIDVVELYQEGSVAATIAVEEYVVRGGRPDGMRHYVDRVVGAHLDSIIERETLRQQDERKLVEEVQLVESAEIVLRRELGRQPTPTEVAARLEWPPERVEALDQMLHVAREIFDSDIALYLDDDEV